MIESASMEAEKAKPAVMGRLAAYMQKRDNTLDAVRLSLALVVALAHALTIKLGPGAEESIRLFDLTSSYMAVNGFFMLSGLLIAWSLDYRHDLVFFSIARALRLLPALIVLALTATLIVGPLLTEMPLKAYFSDPKFWQYPIRVITFGSVADGPPGLFMQSPWKNEFSGSLWTLRYEAIAYVGAALAFSIGLLQNRYGAAILASSAIALFVFMQAYYGTSLNDTGIFALVRFSVCFTIGMSAYAYRHMIVLRWWLLPVFIGTFYLFGNTPVKEVMANLALGYLILLIGFRSSQVLAPVRKFPDMSYGLYIWHWPVYQIFLLFNAQTNPWVLVFLAIPIGFGIAALSWVFVEKPALRAKPFAAATLHKLAHKLGSSRAGTL